ncbi:MAG TPA: Ig-like domain-containing protein, partial [Gemmatimonadales bacterium]|nr:Ig-like domain-containing protein [Gemmatimonadales bacterium]
NSTVTAATPISAGGSSTIDVTVKDGSNNPMSGVTVTLSATGSNTITQPSAATDALGHTSGSLSATVAGSNTITAVAGGVTLSSHPVVVVNPGPQTKLVFFVQPSTTASGATITPAVQVQIQDAFGNLVNSTDNVTVAIGTNPSSGTLSGTKTVAAVGGVASFGDLSINNAGTGYTLTASSGVLTGATSNAFNISASPAQLGFFTQPANTAAGATITPAVQVEIQDNGGSRVTTATNTVTLAFGNNAGGGTLSGTLSVAAINGVATFGNLSINTVATGYTLQASATGLTGVASNAFDITTPVSGSITHSLLTSGHDPTNTSTFTTASIAPAANALVTIAVLTHQASAAAPDPTLTGGGMTSWQVVASVAYDGATPLDRLTIFRGMSAAPGSGPITIQTSVTVSNCQWVVSQWSGVNQSGTNGSGAIAQTNSATGAAVTTLTPTLAAFVSANDAAYGVFGVASATSVVTAGSGFTTIDQQPSGESTVGDLFAEWAVNKPAVTATWPSKNAGGLAVEIKAGP